jgi:hypothetical protein
MSDHELRHCNNDKWHLIPEGDLRAHIADQLCWCDPALENEVIWLHRSLDGREAIEHDGGLLS